MTPVARHEAFPALWEQVPEGLMHLLVESDCAPVHAFASLAVRAVPAFLDALDLDDVMLLLGRPYAPTVRLALELAEKRYASTNEPLPLLSALACANLAEARSKAFSWIAEHRAAALTSAAFLSALITAPHAETRSFVRRFLEGASFEAPLAAATVARVVAALLVLPKSDDGEACASDAAEILQTHFFAAVRALSPEIGRDLLAHPLAGVQALGAAVLLGAGGEGATEADLFALLHSNHIAVRGVALRYVESLPDALLAARELLLVRLITDKFADVRSRAIPLVERAACFDAIAGETMARGLLEALIRRKLPEGAAATVLVVFGGVLAPYIADLPAEDAWRLLQSASPEAQQLGGTRLHGLPVDAFSIDQIVRLASHEILTVREASWRAFEAYVQNELRPSGAPPAATSHQTRIAEASRLLDASWADSRQFGFRVFRTLGAEAFHVDVLITVLDSVRPDVQAFGRELTTKHFREEDGPTLLSKLAEHPTTGVELFTSNYLRGYAAGRPKVIRELVPYFTTVLARVNSGRIAKQRVLAFLEEEGLKSEEAARTIVEVLHRVSCAIAVELRGAAIATMARLCAEFPACGPLAPTFRVVAPPMRERSAKPAPSRSL